MDKKAGRVFQESGEKEQESWQTVSVTQLKCYVCAAECFTTAPFNSSTPSD